MTAGTPPTETGTLTKEQQQLFDQLASEKHQLMKLIRKRVRNSSETEDIYQEAITRLTRQLRSGKPPENPVGYLYRIAINIINENMRRGVRETESIDDYAESMLCQAPQPDQRVSDQQCLALFIKQLNELPPTTRNIIIMRKLHGLTNVEIARYLGLSAKAVEKQLNRALKSVEANMAKHMDPQ